MRELFDLTGNAALCTGASSGIGRRMAIALSQAGADVVLVGRQMDELEHTAETVREHGTGKPAIVAADLLERERLPEIVAEARSKFGAPTILTNAAGINLRQPVDEVSFRTWDDTLNLNLGVPFFLARECVPGMLEKGRGKIINVASLQSFRAFANSIPY
ncbi:MAG: SDR family NAD(P)-dependent oxidoreductase, partial [Boseongicola sp. SB0676_bin_33]|nr:SDR family NAD(P)-dependent oxidoreductase [Boseongicola sp. SB0676_bin_33]